MLFLKVACGLVICKYLLKKRKRLQLFVFVEDDNVVGISANSIFKICKIVLQQIFY